MTEKAGKDWRFAACAFLLLVVVLGIAFAVATIELDKDQAKLVFDSHYVLVTRYANARLNSQVVVLESVLRGCRELVITYQNVISHLHVAAK